MSDPGDSAKCAKCGRMVRVVTCGPSNERFYVDPVRVEVFYSFDSEMPYRNVQALRAFERHRCEK